MGFVARVLRTAVPQTDCILVGGGWTHSGMGMALVRVLASKVAVTHGHEFQEKHQEDGHKSDALGPRVCRNDTGKALIRKRFIRRSHKMDEGRGNDDTRAEVFRNKEGPVRDAQASVPLRKHGKDSAYMELKRERGIETQCNYPT